jgi:hypothetical protein
MEQINIIERRGSHCLVELNGRYAIVEERGDAIYGTDGEHREGYPKSEMGLRAAVPATGWHTKADAQKLLAEVAQRGNDLARRLW